MPLAFDSISHGSIAFGFFNIDSDMLLLDRYFFFATQFCTVIRELADDEDRRIIRSSWQGYHIPDPARIGDLMGAIYGMHHTGFLGEVYLRFPFPKRPEDFKQKPEGYLTQAEMETIILRFASQTNIPLVADTATETVSIGPYEFTQRVFHELIRYVWQGGYPRWRDDAPPDYVHAMRDSIRLSSSRLLNGLKLTP